MSATAPARAPDAAELVLLQPQRLAQMVLAQAARIESLQARVAWFERQSFGQKSERHINQAPAFRPGPCDCRCGAAMRVLSCRGL